MDSTGDAMALLSDHRNRSAMNKPFFIMEELKGLTETYKMYNDCAEDLWRQFDPDCEQATRILRKHEHYLDAVDSITEKS